MLVFGEKIDSFTGEYEFLSNFYPCKIVLSFVEYPSVEHAYVAAKTLDLDIRKKILHIPNAGKVKRFGRTFHIREDWEEVKIPIMTSLLYQKFSQSELKEKLLSTGNRELVEGNTWGDTFWGVCRGKGQNHLGKILMNIREEMKND